MSIRTLVVLCLLLLRIPSAVAQSVDTWCDRYPKEQRQIDLTRLELERSAAAWARAAKEKGQLPRHAASTRNNFIDDHIFGKMEGAGVAPAPLANDAEFLRRVTIDLTGRIPTAAQVRAFLDNGNANKRAELIDSLLNSPEYVDKWTFFFANHFEVLSRYYNMVGVPGRNLFYRFLRDFIEKDRPYRDVASEMIAATGDSYANGPANFIVRGWQDGDPIQDTWDFLTDRLSTRFLGLKTECISCHDGRRHLEQINLYLTGRKRQEFWGQAAFFSRMNLAVVLLDTQDSRRKVLISDRLSGGYHGVVNAANPGPRPPRTGGPYEPTYLFTGEKPRGGEWRKELARMVTSDRQFARAAANYVWAQFFTTGIVDPVDGWDLARIDPKNPPPAPWTLQPTHPELIEALADEFIRSNYSVKSLIRLVANSAAYQLSSRYEGEWRPEFSRYFAKHTPRRMMAEEVYDSVITATGTETPMYVEGFDKPVLYATQLPDALEPFLDGSVRNFLTQFGRGDWWRLPRTSSATVLQVLYLMNDNYVVRRTFGLQGNVSQNTLVGRLMQLSITDENAVEELFLSTLGRFPAEEERTVVMSKRGTLSREQWLADTQWALLNKLDFLFNY